jgi:predicted nucleic acid-binding protein
LLIDELRATLAYPKIRSRLPEDEAELWVALLRRDGVVLPDPPGPPPVRCADPDDDYLVALAAQARAVLVSGDRDVLALSPAIPVMSAREFLTLLDDVNPD